MRLTILFSFGLLIHFSAFAEDLKVARFFQKYGTTTPYSPHYPGKTTFVVVFEGEETDSQKIEDSMVLGLIPYHPQTIEVELERTPHSSFLTAMYQYPKDPESNVAKEIKKRLIFLHQFLKFFPVEEIETSKLTSITSHSLTHGFRSNEEEEKAFEYLEQLATLFVFPTDLTQQVETLMKSESSPKISTIADEKICDRVGTLLGYKASNLKDLAPYPPEIKGIGKSWYPVVLTQQIDLGTNFIQLILREEKKKFFSLLDQDEVKSQIVEQVMDTRRAILDPLEITQAIQNLNAQKTLAGFASRDQKVALFIDINKVMVNPNECIGGKVVHETSKFQVIAHLKRQEDKASRIFPAVLHFIVSPKL